MRLRGQWKASGRLLEGMAFEFAPRQMNYLPPRVPPERSSPASISVSVSTRLSLLLKMTALLPLVASAQGFVVTQLKKISCTCM